MYIEHVYFTPLAYILLHALRLPESRVSPRAFWLWMAMPGSRHRPQNVSVPKVAAKERVRAQRLYQSHAEHLTAAVWDIAGEVSMVPHGLAALLAAAVSESDETWQAKWAGRPEADYVRGHLAFKARALLGKGLGPIRQWEQASESLPPGLATELWHMWGGLDRTCLGKRRATQGGAAGASFGSETSEETQKKRRRGGRGGRPDVRRPTGARSP
jgi:hypothetical protein